MSHGTCKACKKSIIWIQTPAGKNMPVDPGIKFYTLNQQDGQHKLVTPGGRIVTCDLVDIPEEATGMGYVPHWATCKHVEKNQDGGKTKQEKISIAGKLILRSDGRECR